MRTSPTRPSQPGTAGTDEMLWQRCLVGDELAFGELWDRHVNAVYTHCVRRTGNLADAEDLTALTFLEAWRNAPRARLVDSSVRPWLLVVATNLARNHARAKRRYAEVLSRLAQATLTDTAPDHWSSSHVYGSFSDEVVAALERLPRGQQQAVVLCDVAELTYAEAAEAANVPIGTLQSRLARGRARLRKDLSRADNRALTDQELEGTRHD